MAKFSTGEYIIHRLTKSIARVVQYRPRDGTYKLLLLVNNLDSNLHIYPNYNKQYQFYHAKGENRVLVPIKQVKNEWFKANSGAVATLFNGLR